MSSDGSGDQAATEVPDSERGQEDQGQGVREQRVVGSVQEPAEGDPLQATAKVRVTLTGITAEKLELIAKAVEVLDWISIDFEKRVVTLAEPDPETQQTQMQDDLLLWAAEIRMQVKEGIAGYGTSKDPG